MILHVQYLASHGMFSISSETTTRADAALLLCRRSGIDNRLFARLGADTSDALAMQSTGGQSLATGRGVSRVPLNYC